MNSTRLLRRYHYHGIQPDGLCTEGYLINTSKHRVYQALLQAKILPLQIKTAHPFWKKNAFSAADLQKMSAHLGALLKNNMHLLPALNLLEEQASAPAQKQFYQHVSAQVRSGKKLSAALAEFPEYFDATFCHLVACAEHGHHLATTLQHIAAQKKKEIALQSSLKKALSYPLFLLLFSMALTLTILCFVVPPFADFYKQFQAPLPSYTLKLLHLSASLQAQWKLVCFFPVLGFFFIQWAYKHLSVFTHLVDQSLLFFPFLRRGLLAKQGMRWCYCMGYLLSGNISLLPSLILAQGCFTNTIYQKKMRGILQELRGGKSLSDALELHQAVDETVLSQLRVSEKMGALSTCFMHLAEQHQQEWETFMAEAHRWIGPLLLIFISGLIAFLLLALYTPILQLGMVV